MITLSNDEVKKSDPLIADQHPQYGDVFEYSDHSGIVFVGEHKGFVQIDRHGKVMFSGNNLSTRGHRVDIDIVVRRQC